MAKINFNYCSEFVWQKDTTSFAIAEVDSLKIENPVNALGNSTLIKHNVGLTKKYNFENDWQMASLTVVIICLYCYVIARFVRPITQMFKNCLSADATLTMHNNPSRDFNKFILTSKYLALISTAVIMAVAIDEISKCDNSQSIIAVAISGVILFLIFALRNIVRNIASKVSQSNAFFDNIKFIENFNIALISVVITPFAIVIPFFNQIFGYVLVATSAIYLYHIFRLYLFIAGKKFSFMQWFLYLCGAEWMPIVVIIAAVTIVNNIVLS